MAQLRHMLRDDDVNHEEQKQILELGMKFRLWDVIKIIVWTERLAGVVVSPQFRCTVGLCVRMVLACYVIRYKIYDYF